MHRTLSTRLRQVALILMIVTLAGCAAKQIHPGAMNNFDSQSYDTLITAQGAIEGAKADVRILSMPMGPRIINTAILSYNTALDSYLAYHSGVTNDQTSLQAALVKLVTDIAQIQKSAGRTVTKQ